MKELHFESNAVPPEIARLVASARAGEEVVIDIGGVQVARVVPVTTPQAGANAVGPHGGAKTLEELLADIPLQHRRPIGGLEGKVRIAPDFDVLPSEIAEAFGV